jgi:hypothetical protein
MAFLSANGASSHCNEHAPAKSKRTSIANDSLHFLSLLTTLICRYDKLCHVAAGIDFLAADPTLSDEDASDQNRCGASDE